MWRLRFDKKLPASVLQRLEAAQVRLLPLHYQCIHWPDACGTGFSV